MGFALIVAVTDQILVTALHNKFIILYITCIIMKDYNGHIVATKIILLMINCNIYIIKGLTTMILSINNK